MLSLLEMVDRMRAGESLSEHEVRAHQNSANPAERFLAHHVLATLAMQSSREHLIDALRAIGYGDRQVLQQFLSLSKVLGQSGEIASSVANYGHATIDRGQWAAGLEALQQALRFDQANGGELAGDEQAWLAIADRYELAARALGRRVSRPRPMDGPVRVGILTSGIRDGSQVARLLAGWMRYANPDDVQLRVYSSETWASPPKHGLAVTSPTPPSTQSGAGIIAELKARRIEVWCTPTEADPVQKARMLTERIVRDHIETMLIDATLADSAIWMAIANRPAERQIALLRRWPVGIGGVDTLVAVDEPSIYDDASAWTRRGIPSRAVFQGIETEADVHPVDRSTYGISADAVVAITCTDDPAKSLTPAFVKTVARLLSENPRAVYLVTGEGDLGALKRAFESAGVAKRVGYAGRRRDVGSLVAMADVYLAEFPSSGREGVLAAMSVGRPVMILGGAEHDVPGNAKFVGSPNAVVGGVTTYLERTAAMLRDAQLRATVGEAMGRRAAEKYSLRRTIEQLVGLSLEAIALRPRPSAFPEGDDVAAPLPFIAPPISKVA